MVWGAVDIGKLINRTPREVFYLHRQKLIPTRNVGGQIVAERDKLCDLSQWPKQSEQEPAE